MMHDWTLLTLLVDWQKGTATITFGDSQSHEVFLVADELSYIEIPKQEEWGRSASVNEVVGPRKLENGNSFFSIEMQSGDKIELEAKSISLPDS